MHITMKSPIMYMDNECNTSTSPLTQGKIGGFYSGKQQNTWGLLGGYPGMKEHGSPRPKEWAELYKKYPQEQKSMALREQACNVQVDYTSYSGYINQPKWDGLYSIPEDDT